MDFQYEELFDSSFSLRSGYFFVYPKNDEMQIRQGHLSACNVSISGSENDTWIKSAFELLSSGTKLQEVCKEVPNEKVDQFVKIVLSLRVNYLQINTANSSESKNSSLKYQTLLLENSDKSKFLKESMADAQILLIGSGILGSRVAINLAQYDVGNLTLLDRKVITHKDKYQNPAYVLASEGQPRATELRNFLVKMTGIDKITSEHMENMDKTRLAQLIKSHSMVLMVEDIFDPNLYHFVNQNAIQTKTPWMMAMIDGWDMYIEPTFIPFQTGCYECLNQTHITQMDNGDTFLKYEEYLKDNGFIGELVLTLALADIAAGFLSSELPQVMGIMPQRIDFNSSLTLGRQLHINLRNYDATFRNIIKFPRCSVCSLKNDDSLNLYT